MAKVYAVANQKGGVGKTTTTRNLSTALALRGKKVIAIDFDPQGHLTISFGIDPLKLGKHTYHMLIDDAVTLASILIFHPTSRIGLIPTNLDLAGAEIELMMDPMGNNVVLRSKIAPIRDQIDYVFIDCPPSLGLLSINALTAADGVIIPVQTQYLAYHGLQRLLDTVTKVRQRANPTLQVTGILPTFYNSRANHDNEVLSSLRTHYKSVLIDIPIPMRVALSDATKEGQSIQEYDQSADVAALYARIAEVIDRG